MYCKNEPSCFMFKSECIDHFHDCDGLEVEQIQRTGSQTYHCADGLYLTYYPLKVLQQVKYMSIVSNDYSGKKASPEYE